MEIRWHLNGTFRRIRATDHRIEFYTETRPLEFIPDCHQLIKLARGSYD